MSKISAKARKELVAAVAERYQTGTATEKGCILDEFTALTGYHRKHAIRVLNGNAPKLPGRRGRRCLYDQAVTEALVVLWEASDRVCGKRLKALLPVLVPALERHGYLGLDPQVREGCLVVEALDQLRKALPFPLRGLDTDNGSEFLNDTLISYCSDQGIELTRSRPYRKNDQAWVEQKNGAVVRWLVGYGRLEGVAAAATKDRLGALLGTLDPLLGLLDEIRTVQHHLAALAAGATVQPMPQRDAELDRFLRSLALAWRAGEVRPTHQPAAKPPRW